MTDLFRVCEKCGATISSDATRELCPACLLESGLGLLGHEGEPGAVHEARPRRRLGDFGEYEMLEEIGRGGQGIVYRAHQKSLNRTVALKVIGSGLWTTEAHLRRFRREAEAAASLDHPGIIPVYEVGELDGSCYFSMKFVEGGQLDDAVKRTPIAIRRAVELIAKLARTVHYAHEHGILHRDIKPGNILLDAQGEPLLGDFGLAGLLETQSTITHTLEVMGTPSYMAPEQAAGEHSNVSKATDIYGLGAVLYELLTGHPPFAGGTSYQTIHLLIDTEPRQPRLWNRKIDRELSTICLKCLEKDPKRRYDSALALAEDLEHWLKHEPIQARRTGLLVRGRKWVRRNPSTAGLVTLLVALAAGSGVVVWNRVFAVPMPKSVAVLPFDNLSGDRENAYFAEGIQEEILTRLATIAELKVISNTSTQRYQSKPRNLAQIAKQLGVANVVEGSVQKAADQIRVNVQLINAQTDSHLWAETYDRKLSDIFGVESDIAKRIAESLEAKLTGREAQALATKPTNNPEAYDAYLRGLAFEARGAYSLDLLDKAISFYEQTVQLDPTFATAWARLSRANAKLYFRLLHPARAVRDAAKNALQNAQKLEPNSPDTLLALGYYQFWALGDYPAAKATFELARKALSSSSEVVEALGAVSRCEGKWEESVAYFKEALALDPRNAELLSNAAYTHTQLRQFPAALKLYERALDVMPNDPDLMTNKASIYQAEGRLQDASKMLSEANVQSPVGLFATKIMQVTLERNYREAIRLLQLRQAGFHFPSELERAQNQIWLAFAQRLTGDITEAKIAAAQARSTLEQLAKNEADNVILAGWLSLSYAALGEKESALKEGKRAVRLLPSTKDRQNGPGFEENLARIQTMFGEDDLAISTLRMLLQTPYVSVLIYAPTPVTPALLRLDPTWDPLRADPAFQKLCEAKQP